MVLFNLLWIISLATLTIVYSYFFLERFSIYYLFFTLFNLIIAVSGIKLSNILYDKYYFAFFFFVLVSMQFLSIAVMSLKSAFYYKDIITAEKSREEKKKWDNNKYYQRAKTDVEDLLEKKENSDE